MSSGARETTSPSGQTPTTLPASRADAAGADIAAPREPAALTSERYVLDREIGRGGMGRVFAGRDLRLQRPIAIKMLRVQDAGLANRFEREVMLGARLQHPGVVPVYDAGFWPSGEPFLVMKLVLGQSLARVIKDADTRADRLALLPHVIAAADAVAYAHDQGIVHRDLKPTNILVGAFGETLVVDWGLAKDLRAHPAPELASPGDAGALPAGDTASGTVVGTPSYMPPEQAEGRPVDPRADVYALGAILYFLLSSTPPRPPSGANQERGGPPVPLPALEPRLPADLVAIVEKAMAAEPPGRYPSAFELAEDLKRFQAGKLVGARRYSPVSRLARFALRHPIVVAATAAAALAAVAAHWLR
jgi:serine/threonine protein kinase